MQSPRIHRILTSLALLTAGICQMSLAQATAASSSIAAPRPVAQANRIAANADLGPQTQLTGHIPAWVTPVHQTAAAVDLSTPIRISLVLRRDPAVEAALDQLLADQQNPASPHFHQWLTPEQLGALYGPTQSDLDAITSWATSQGLTVASLQPNRVILELSGTLAAFSSAFHTSFANFTFGDQVRLSATSEPSIPTAFGAVIQSIHGLTETHLQPQSRFSLHTLPAATAKSQAAPTPQTTFTNPTEHFMLPNDFAVIYDIASVYSGGDTGATIASAAQHVAIIGESRIVAADMTNFEGIAGLPSSQPNTIIAGSDPGTSTGGAGGEATLDVQRVLSTAPGAQVDLVISGNSGNSDGIDIAIAYNINTLRDPIMTISFGGCEAQAGQSAATFYNTEFQTAAGEGMSVFVSSDDSGAAGCDANFSTAPANQLLSINDLCSSTYVTCVGGTEFNDSANPSVYWASSNSQPGNESALSYIPEGAWNEPDATNSSGTFTGYQVAATGGGSSVYIARPSWQTGATFPSGSFRLTPDVSFSAADHDGYIGCFAGGGGSCITTNNGTPFVIFSGTSAAAPSMAGIAALINTKLGSAQGNMNPLIYRVAAATPAAIHDATVASSGVTGCTTATPSMCNNSTPGPSTLTGGLAGYALLTGYDEATGLGSLDVAKFLSAASVTTVATSLSATALPNPAVINQTVTLTATLTPGTSTSTPTGTVQFYSNGVAIGSPATLTANVASTTYSFATAGTYAITATYSGDTNFAPSTASAVSLVINTPSFTVTPATTSYNLISGATTGNTDTIAVTSTGSFAGLVNLTCVATSASGTAAGTCTLTPPAVTLTAGSTANSTLLITTTPGTSGILDIRITGTSGSTTVTSALIAVNLTPASFTMSPAPATVSLVSGKSATSTVTLTSTNGFTGTVALTCTTATTSGTAAGACSVLPTSVALVSGGTITTGVTITTTPGTSGSLTATISGSGTTAGATLTATASTTVVATLTAPTFTLAASPSTLSFTSGATTGNTDTVTISSVNGFTGSVSFSPCTISSSSAYYQPTCTISPSTVTVPASGTVPTVIVTVNSTVQTAALNRSFPLKTTFLALLLFIPALRRRRKFLALILLFCGISAISGCSSGSAPVPKSSAGTYTVTISATGTTTGGSIATNASTSFSLTIN